MRVFICEYVTSGGLRDKALPEDALPEATLIRDALISDLEQLPGMSVILAHDDRLPPPSEDSVPVRKGDDPWVVWSGLAQEADVVWPVAPETDGILPRLIRLLQENQARLVASDPTTVELTSSRLRTAARLAEHQIPHLPTYPLDALPADFDGDIVTKPDIGSSYSSTKAWPNRRSLPKALTTKGAGMIGQPFLSAKPASLSVLARPDGTRLLAVNHLDVHHLVGSFSLQGITVGGLDDPDGALADLAGKVVAAFPGLSSLIGIDVLLAPTGPVVAKVNARITPAYAGLHASLGVNPIAFLPELIREGKPPSLPHLPRPTPVALKLR